MKRLLIFTIITFVLASVSQAASEEKGSKCSKDKIEAKCKASKEAKEQGKWQGKGHKAGFDKFKKHHKELICQLKKIRETAAKENSTETLAAIDELIAKTQERFHKKAKLIKEKCADKANKAESESCSKTKKASSKCYSKCDSKAEKAKTCPFAETAKDK